MQETVKKIVFNPGPEYRNPLYASEYRNMPCPCLSGKKVKKCHGREYSVKKDEYDEIIRIGDEANKRYLESYNKNLQTEIDKLDQK